MSQIHKQSPNYISLKTMQLAYTQQHLVPSLAISPLIHLPMSAIGMHTHLHISSLIIGPNITFNKAIQAYECLNTQEKS